MEFLFCESTSFLFKCVGCQLLAGPLGGSHTVFDRVGSCECRGVCPCLWVNTSDVDLTFAILNGA